MVFHHQGYDWQKRLEEHRNQTEANLRDLNKKQFLVRGGISVLQQQHGRPSSAYDLSSLQVRSYMCACVCVF